MRGRKIVIKTDVLVVPAVG